MQTLLAARSQMGTSLIFHIIFSVLGVGLPLMLFLAEGLALWRKDATWMMLARQWTKTFGILFAIGAVSGAIVEFEITLLWPTFTNYSGAIIGLPFALEGFAFFLEGIFLGIYIYGTKRLTPLVHWLCSLPIVLSGTTSAWFIVSANSWMNSPTGFEVVHGQVINVDPFHAILNASTPYETTHMILACFVVTGFGAAGVYATGLLRGKRDDYHRKGFLLSMAIGSVAIPLQIISGDLNARFLEKAQPPKYAALEGILHSGNGLPFYLGGFVNQQTGKVDYALTIPHGESLISHFNLNSHTTGLDAFPPNNQPPAWVVHLAFQGMVGCGLFALLIAVLFWWLYFRRKRVIPEQKWLLWGAIIAGPLSFIALELGWITTEEGRQPWIIYGLLRVSDAVNPAPWVGVSFLLFCLIYLLLAITLVAFLLLLARQPKQHLSWSELIEGKSEQKEQESEQLVSIL